MGQYFYPLVLTKNERNQDRPESWILAHDIKYKCTAYNGTKFITGVGLKLLEHSWIGNQLCNLVEYLLCPGNQWHMKRLVWAGDYAPGEYHNTYNWLDTDGYIRTHKENLEDFCVDENQYKVTKKYKPLKCFRYLINHTTKQYVDKKKVPKVDGWQLHPLPILTCEGNLSDFHGKDDNNIMGSWARDIISVDKEIPHGYTELIFDLTE